jgi:putative RNA 2'-phosphotransferase
MGKDAALMRLSRTVSHALRHEPWLYELELDDAGWVPVEALIAALRAQTPAWPALAEADLALMIARAEKQRFELKNGRIRALYGHSTPQRLLKEKAEPPAILYHGTAPETAERVRHEGLRPMGRQYVHLSADAAMAAEVGRRKAAWPAILEVHAGAAHAAGIAFYRGNERVWLADAVPPEFIAHRA